jgi:hypothetical protein
VGKQQQLPAAAALQDPLDCSSWDLYGQAVEGIASASSAWWQVLLQGNGQVGLHHSHHLLLCAFFVAFWQCLGAARHCLAEGLGCQQRPPV